MGARAVLECVLIGLVVTACEILPRPGDTQGVQTAGEWDQHGRIVVQQDPRYTLTHLRVDTTEAGGGAGEVGEGRDVVLARFDFDPSEAAGDEYSLSIALDLGDARARAANHPYSLGDSIPAFATVTCLCRPLRADSVRGSYTIQTRGLRQIAGRIDATLYFTAWNDPKTHATYRLRQRIHGVRP